MAPTEIEQLLAKMVEARDELRETIGQAHAARKDLLHTIKTEIDTLRQIITDEVHSAVGALGEVAAEEMATSITKVINRIEADWRDKLGLP